MRAEDRAEFINILKRTAALIGCQPMAADGAQLFFDLLDLYSIDEVKAAFHRHLRSDTGQFMPKPADIIRCLEGGSDTKADMAWTKVEQAIRSVGGYDTVVFDDPAIHAVIADMGGWISICKVSNDELPFKRNEFVRRHRGYNGRTPQNYPRKLIGIAEAHNSREGLDIEEPKLIGNPEKAVQVYQLGSNKSSLAITQMGANGLEHLLADLLPSEVVQ